MVFSVSTDYSVGFFMAAYNVQVRPILEASKQSVRLGRVEIVAERVGVS